MIDSCLTASPMTFKLVRDGKIWRAFVYACWSPNQDMARVYGTVIDRSNMVAIVKDENKSVC